ncbi:MAG TPA: hypothetical protein VG898_11835 [Solirubrobacterales bacterium]|nr:hypothetical protein [Solirubrobacterales bacterium]
MSRKRETRQFRDACRAAGIRTIEERARASVDFHTYKRQIGLRGHLSYRELVEWLRAWKG